MRFLRSCLVDPRCHLGVLLILLGSWFAAAVARRQAAPCPACPGHTDSADACLCYHVPPTAGSLPSRR